MFGWAECHARKTRKEGRKKSGLHNRGEKPHPDNKRQRLQKPATTAKKIVRLKQKVIQRGRDQGTSGHRYLKRRLWRVEMGGLEQSFSGSDWGFSGRESDKGV